MQRVNPEMRHVTTQFIGHLSPYAKNPTFIAWGLRLAMLRYGIDTRRRQAHFLGQLMHETLRFRYAEEIWGPTVQQRRYDPASGSTLARKLGNIYPGDGERFKGRGYIQLTGRYNYERYQEHLLSVEGEEAPDILSDPSLVATTHYAADVAGWFWKAHGLSLLADADDSERVTLRINGGRNGLADRIQETRRAWDLLGGQPSDPMTWLPEKLVPRELAVLDVPLVHLPREVRIA